MDDRARYGQALALHYAAAWKSQGVPRRLGMGPEVSPGFHVLEFAFSHRAGCAYATCGMTTAASPIEVHLLAPRPDAAHVERLTAIAHYHQTGASLGVGHTVNFGRAWLPGSSCTHGLISRPYLDGPSLEEWRGPDREVGVRCLWRIPINASEREYAVKHGLAALEERFEAAPLDYLNPFRAGVV